MLKNKAKLLLNYKPFRVDIIEKDEIIVSVNSANKLKFEHFRKKVSSVFMSHF